MKVRIGYGLGTRSAVEDFDGFVDALEASGFDSLWLSERITGPIPDPVVALSYAAGRTVKLKFGMSVMVLPGRNPVLVAKELASLDRLSGGRLLPAFGLGAAEPAEHMAFGVTRETRAKVFDESLTLIRRLWTEDVVTHHGEHFSVTDLRVLPKPKQQPPDVWLGGIAPSELRRVGRMADGWLPSFVTPGDVAAARSTIEQAAAEHQRVIDPEHYGVLIPYGSDPLPESMLQLLAKRRPGTDPRQVVAAGLDHAATLIGRFIDVGFSKFVMVPLVDPTDWSSHLAEMAEVLLPLET